MTARSICALALLAHAHLRRAPSYAPTSEPGVPLAFANTNATNRSGDVAVFEPTRNVTFQTNDTWGHAAGKDKWKRDYTTTPAPLRAPDVGFNDLHRGDGAAQQYDFPPHDFKNVTPPPPLEMVQPLWSSTTPPPGVTLWNGDHYGDYKKCKGSEPEVQVASRAACQELAEDKLERFYTYTPGIKNMCAVAASCDETESTSGRSHIYSKDAKPASFVEPKHASGSESRALLRQDGGIHPSDKVQLRMKHVTKVDDIYSILDAQFHRRKAAAPAQRAGSAKPTVADQGAGSKPTVAEQGAGSTRRKPQAPAPWTLPSDIAVGMVTTLQDPYRSRAAAVESTWAPYVQSFAAYTFDPVDPAANATRYVHVDRAFPDEAAGRSTNLNLALVARMLDDFPEAKWYVQVDDDTLLFPHELQKALEAQDASKSILGGLCAGYPLPPPEDFGFAVGGAGLVLSRTLALALRPHVAECRHWYNDLKAGDAKVGSCLKHALPELYKNAVQCFAGHTNDDPCKNQIFKGKESVVSLQMKDTAAFSALWRWMGSRVSRKTPITRDLVATSAASGVCKHSVERELRKLAVNGTGALAPWKRFNDPATNGTK